jgi:fatty-acyl-CoA synthase
VSERAVEEHNLWSLFRAVAAAVPDRDAVVGGSDRVSFAELVDRSTSVALVLEQAGLGLTRECTELEDWELGQDTVGLLLVNCPEYLESLLGSLAARAVPFNVNHRYTAPELRHLIDDAHASALVFHARFAGVLAEVLPLLASPLRLLLQVDDGSGAALLDRALAYDEVLRMAGSDGPRATPQPDDAYVLYTGGTIDAPKAAIRRQADIWMSALGGEFVPEVDRSAIARAASATEPSRMFPNAPLMHGAAQCFTLRTLLSGQTVVLGPATDGLDARTVWQTIQDEGLIATVFVGDPVAQRVIDELEARSYDTSYMKFVFCGGAMTSPATKARILTFLPQVMLVDIAGSTETGGGSRAWRCRDQSSRRRCLSRRLSSRCSTRPGPSDSPAATTDPGGWPSRATSRWATSAIATRRWRPFPSSTASAGRSRATAPDCAPTGSWSSSGGTPPPSTRAVRRCSARRSSERSGSTPPSPTWSW